MIGEICDVNGEIFDSAEISNVHYTASWILSGIDHEPCQNKLQADARVPSFVSVLTTLKKDARRERAGAKLTSFLTSVVQYFKENFFTFLESSANGVKDRLLKNILSMDMVQELLCKDCAEKIIGKYLNMLIKAKLNELNQTFTDVSRSKNDSVAQKAQKLNITK